MQFLWKYVDDMVGKGAEMKVLAELFFYAALYSVPLALPVAILFASLMTFGNLGEHLELLAMKSSGISLIRIMKPLIVLTVFISVIAFVFQNNVLPSAQTKLWTIIISLRQKSPELEIPEKTFYKVISGYNIYVRNKSKDGLLHNVKIYDHSKGFNELKVTVADSGRMKTSEDKKYLILTLYNGESFENMGNNNQRNTRAPIPFLRQTFTLRDILIEFDSNFSMADESVMRDREVSKNVPELLSFIRTESVKNDSVTKTITPPFVSQVYTATFKQDRSYPANRNQPADTLLVDNFEAYYKSLPFSQQLTVLDNAKMKTERLMNDYNFRMVEQSSSQMSIRRHQIEYHRKFAYSLACLLFFFIGAPLGAIIRKGGMGLPSILSVFIFILYYTVDTFGWKMARQDSWPVWEGTWLSAFFLAGLGIFLTYKAVNDSVVMNPDAWKEAWQRLLGKREIRNYSRKEMIMEQPDYPEDICSMEKWNEEANRYLAQKQKIPFYFYFWKQDFHDKRLDELFTSMNLWIEDLLNTNENLIIGKLMDYPVINPYRLAVLNRPALRWSCSILLPVGILIYTLCFFKQRQINNDLQASMKVNEEISKELRNLNLS
jgi:lipopolysaccharide export system permease protein